MKSPDEDPHSADVDAASTPSSTTEQDEMERIDHLVELISPSNLSVLILGETGVGKEVLAGTIHRRSHRAGAPFVGLNCAAFTETLLESELFGYERGAFTGADTAKAGLIESANGGTLLLDEIGELPLATQAKILRVLESREVRRIGSVAASLIDVRFLAATNRNLEECVEQATFRRDLYYRLNAVTIEIPPLRRRLAEIPRLARSFIAAAATAHARPEVSITDAALRCLMAHSWPGNIRELKNVIERAVVLSRGRAIEPIDLGLGEERTRSVSRPGATVPEVSNLPDNEDAEHGSLFSELRRIERRRIEDALEACNGNQTKAAARLGISLRAFVNRLDQYDIPRPRRGRR